MVSSMCGDTLERSTKKNCAFPTVSMVVVASWSGAAWLLLVLGSCGSLRETWIQHVLWHSEAEDDAFPSETVFQHNNHHKNTAEMTLPCCGRWRWWSGQVCLQTWTLLSTCGASFKRKVEKHHVSLWCHYGGVEEDASNILCSSGEFHAQED